MRLVEKVLGNISEPEWEKRLKAIDPDTLELSQWEAQKSRLRKTTSKGDVMAVSLERGVVLHDGDVLFWDPDNKEAVVCRIDLREVLVIDLSGLKNLSAEQRIERCVQLGHALGNQHWPAVVSGNVVYVPLAVNRLVMNSVMKTHHFSGLTYHFAPGSEILDKLDPAQARRLFGGGEMLPGHGHAHASGHEHAEESHEHAHEH